MRLARSADDCKKSNHGEYDRVESYERIGCGVLNNDHAGRGNNGGGRRHKGMNARIRGRPDDEKSYHRDAACCDNVTLIFAAITWISR